MPNAMMTDDEMRATRVRRSRVKNIDTDRLHFRRSMLLDVSGYVRQTADGSKRHACQLIGERVAIEGELLKRGEHLDGPILPASPYAQAILEAGGTLVGEQGPRR